MTTLRAHFDGHAIVLDEPAELTVGQAVRVIVEDSTAGLSELRQRTDHSLQPTREAFAASGMTDDELAEFLEAETHSMRGIPYKGK